ncbi:MAG: BACON domain-containing protein [Bacteroidales bacterium]|nr:BACON domain-containing protein [Bacteroidales bacterium]
MKLKYIFASLVAVLAFAVSCEKEADHYLDEIKVDKSYLGFAQSGGSATISLTSTGSWTVSVPDKAAGWLSVSPASGSAGTASITISADATDETREATIAINCEGKTQNVNVIQQAEKTEKPVTPIATVISTGAGSFRVRGTVTRLVNDQYGNFYIEDETASIYIYGVKDAQGYPKDGSGGWARFGIDVGDIVTLEGPYTKYGDTDELVDAEVIKVEKSLIQVADFDFQKLPPVDTTFKMVVTAKESPLLVSSDSDWLQVVAVNTDGSYRLHADENPRTAERTANISISGPTARKSVAITQEGVPATGASVSEIIAMEDKSLVKTLPSTVVVALTSRGAVLSDGTKAIYAYGNKAAALKVGDGVSMAAEKTTYNGVPELTNITEVFVDSEGNPVNHPDAVDITAQAGTYEAAEAAYVKLTGTLSISDNYYNIALDAFPEGDKQGSIVYPVDALGAKNFDGKKITVTGYFNGLSSKGKYINIIATKIVEAVDNPKGTADNPYLASEIAELLLAGEKFDENIYIKGKVSAVLYTFSASYGTGTFWISDDGVAHGIAADKKSTTAPAKDFECYSVYWYNNTPWAEGNAQVEVGDEVVICGKTTVYNGVAETSSKNAWVYSVNGATTDADGLGNASSPFNVAGAEAFIDRMEAAKAAAAENDQPAPTFPDVFVKGKVSAVLYTFSASYGTGTFWISDDGTAHGISADKKTTTDPAKDFECYSVYWYNNTPWAEGNGQIAEGDEVVIKGQLTLYKGTYETSGKNAWVYSLNGKTE